MSEQLLEQISVKDGDVIVARGSWDREELRELIRGLRNRGLDNVVVMHLDDSKSLDVASTPQLLELRNSVNTALWRKRCEAPQ